MNEFFGIANLAVLPAWLLLAFAPRWKWTERLVLSGVWSLAMSVVYLLLVVRWMPGANGGFSSLEQVRSFFMSDGLLLAGWTHYLAFDLLIGVFEVRQAREHSIPHLLVVPCLALTLYLGPIGFLLFFIVKSIRLKRVAEVGPR